MKLFKFEIRFRDRDSRTCSNEKKDQRADHSHGESPTVECTIGGDGGVSFLGRPAGVVSVPRLNR